MVMYYSGRMGIRQKKIGTRKRGMAPSESQTGSACVT